MKPERLLSMNLIRDNGDSATPSGLEMIFLGGYPGVAPRNPPQPRANFWNPFGVLWQYRFRGSTPINREQVREFFRQFSRHELC